MELQMLQILQLAQSGTCLLLKIKHFGLKKDDKGLEHGALYVKFFSL